MALAGCLPARVRGVSLFIDNASGGSGFIDHFKKGPSPGLTLCGSLTKIAPNPFAAGKMLARFVDCTTMFISAKLCCIGAPTAMELNFASKALGGEFVLTYGDSNGSDDVAPTSGFPAGTYTVQVHAEKEPGGRVGVMEVELGDSQSQTNDFSTTSPHTFSFAGFTISGSSEPIVLTFSPAESQSSRFDVYVTKIDVVKTA